MHRHTFNPFTFAAGLVLVVISGYFLLAEDTSLSRQVATLVPAVLLVAGATLVIGATRR